MLFAFLGTKIRKDVNLKEEKESEAMQADIGGEEDETFTDISLADDTVDSRPAALYTKPENELFIMNCDIDGDMENQVEMEEKTRLINQVLELQHTLEDLSARVDAVKEENLKLKSENQVLGQYIENLMSASSVFQTTDTKSKRK
ncbi:short coiled-coil protein B isoform X1 [Dunckerocampus dactyliophorus]|uniref:short coiled-coil protein B isoform X1 n=1 Tax=Dunckerocampus dactyliophorus TaxID=161453 RepID=UPI00240763CE|nr:short coiled-coil protein B isoform X1 [Dunckerocampus dactyliophorus]